MSASKYLSKPCLPALAVACLLSIAAAAQVQLPRVFSDHMVLQRDAPIHVWGLAAPGEAVSVSLGADTAQFTADALGRWTVQLPSRAAGGGPLTLTVRGTTTAEVKDILMGDVWLASGQSNMEMPLAGFPNSAVLKDGPAEIAKANYPEIRLLLVKRAASLYPLDDLADAAPWQICTPESAAKFSAVGYFFGRAIHQKEKVPIGLIDSSVGGTPAEAWTSLDGLARMGSLSAVLAQRAMDMNAEPAYLRQKTLDAQTATSGKPLPKRPGDQKDNWNLAALWNGMVAPLTSMPIRGVVWFQGESNASQERAPYYADVFASMIGDWRRKWGIGDFPFLYAQISGYNTGTRDGWAVTREAQRQALSLKNTGMAVTIDVGEEHQIHFANKQAVGERLALLARSIAYGETLVSNGPLFKDAVPEQGALRVRFDSAAGLKASDGKLGGFELAGADKIFASADAIINNGSIVVRNGTVASPVYVRYAWKSWPTGANLVNAAGLPASPFTSMTLDKNQASIK